jgi:molybdopterin-binding protein
MQLSARNQLRGTLTSVRTYGLMAEVTMELSAGQVIVAVITSASVESLKLKEGDQVTAVIKATEVMVAK